MKPLPRACDFCSNPDVRWSYPAESFVVEVGEIGLPPVQLGSRGGWDACDGCHSLIEKTDRGALTERAMVLLGFPPGPVYQGVMRQIHDLFFKCRRGPATEVKP
jgi:hypothetical protein